MQNMSNRKAGVFNQRNSADLADAEQADEEILPDFMGWAEDDSHPDDDDDGETQRRQKGLVFVRATGRYPVHVASNLGAVENVGVEGDADSDDEPLLQMKLHTLARATAVPGHSDRGQATKLDAEEESSIALDFSSRVTPRSAVISVVSNESGEEAMLEIRNDNDDRYKSGVGQVPKVELSNNNNNNSLSLSLSCVGFQLARNSNKRSNSAVANESGEEAMQRMESSFKILTHSPPGSPGG
uniref:Uncharacterized protein n=1 Tax=Glossina austeni TaxID=7395 RepID=A0A1A9UV12_GLOAU